MAKLIPPQLCDASFSLLFQGIQEIMPPLRQHFVDERNYRHSDTKIKESESIPTLFHSYVKIKNYTLQQC